jgi:hypothetical protein
VTSLTIRCPGCSASATIGLVTGDIALHVTLHHDADCNFYEGDHDD